MLGASVPCESETVRPPMVLEVEGSHVGGTQQHRDGLVELPLEKGRALLQYQSFKESLVTL